MDILVIDIVEWMFLEFVWKFVVILEIDFLVVGMGYVGFI